jgi:hypothetical protein
MIDPIQKENTPRLKPENQFPTEAIKESIQVPALVTDTPANAGNIMLVFSVANEVITEWGPNTRRRDQELRAFWPTEPYLAGAIVSASFRNAAYDWVIKHPSKAVVKAVTGMLNRAIAGDKIGWQDFVKKISQDLYTTDNGAFIEIIRDESNPGLKGMNAPVIGIAHLDSNQCMRTGNPETPVIYEDRDGVLHKLKWYQVIALSEYPSAIERMNGVGYCAVSRILALAKIMKDMQTLKGEMIGGRNSKDINIVGGVSNSAIKDAVKRTQEKANNAGNIRYIDNVVLASLDPEKPVSVATVRLAAFPEGFTYQEEMEWYISGIALNLGTDYQDLAPLPGGGIGTGTQGDQLSRKSSGKGPRNFMDTIAGSFKTYGVLPREATMEYNDKNEQEELEKQNVRTKAIEEMAIAVNSKIMTPEAALKSLVSRGIYSQEDADNIPDDWWKNALNQAANEAKGQPVGSRGGNTIAEDAGRKDTGKTKPNSNGALRKMWNEFFRKD